MKILFSNPPWWEAHNREPRDGDDWRTHHVSELRYGIRAGSRWPFTVAAHCAPDQFSFGGYLPFPFFLSYAASYAARAFPGATVTLRDSIALRESYEGWLLLLKHTQPDWVVIESATPSWDHDSRCIRLLAENCPEARVIVTGTITSTRAAEALKLPGVVAAVQGEFEKGVARVIRGERGVIEHDLLTLEEMNRAPFPLIPENVAWNYWDACPKGQSAPQLQFWSSRGCPFKCAFCGWPAVMTGNDPDGTKPRRVRNYSPEYMLAMLSEAVGKWGYQCLYDDSDTFNLQERHTLEMCEVYAKIGKPWSAMCRADTISRKAWHEMKRTGCFGVKLGFESGSQRVIDQIINKHLDLAKARETAIWLRSIGLAVHGTFSIGHQGETPAEARRTQEFIAELYRDGALDTHQLSGTAVIEGTPMDRIEHGEALSAYPQAHVDANYASSKDGQRKIEEMRR